MAEKDAVITFRPNPKAQEAYAIATREEFLAVAPPRMTQIVVGDEWLVIDLEEHTVTGDLEHVSEAASLFVTAMRNLLGEAVTRG